jgi:hypothetical protein
LIETVSDMVESMTQPLPKARAPPSTITPPSSPPAHSDLLPLGTPEQSWSKPEYPLPLYTEINIPLPASPGSMSDPLSSTNPKSHRSLHSLSPFSHRRRASSPAASPEHVRESRKPEPRRIELSMRDVTKGGKKRSGTIDAAIVPAVMVLRAELFTPGVGERSENMEVGKDTLEVIK